MNLSELLGRFALSEVEKNDTGKDLSGGDELLKLFDLISKTGEHLQEELKVRIVLLLYLTIFSTILSDTYIFLRVHYMQQRPLTMAFNCLIDR